MAAKFTIRNFHDTQMLNYSGRDITTIYDVLIKQDFDELCSFCLSTKLFAPKAHPFGGHTAMLNYFNSFKRLLISIGPDYNHSAADIVIPWNGASLQGLCGCSWSEILGRRIVLPSTMSKKQCMFCMLLIMLAMSHVTIVEQSLT